MKTLIFLGLMATVLFACKTQKEATKNGGEITSADTAYKDFQNIAENDSLFATIERSWCFGKCPVYKVEVYNDGTVLYHGKANVENEGDFIGQVSATEMKSLLSIVKRIGYNGFKEQYDNNISDIPSCTTSIVIDGKRYTVQRRGPGPDGLTAFEKSFDEMIAKTPLESQNR